VAVRDLRGALGSSARSHPWRGLALYGVDGTTLRVPDSTNLSRLLAAKRIATG